MFDNYVILLTKVTAAMLKVYLLQQCIVVNLPLLANCCVLYAGRITSTLEFSNIRILVLFLFTVSVPPTWRRVMAMTSLHLMYSVPFKIHN